MTGVIFDKFLSNSRDTQGIKISLSVGEILAVKWWVDTSYTVNEDFQVMIGQSGLTNMA